jgi:hypothetical protein
MTRLGTYPEKRSKQSIRNGGYSPRNEASLCANISETLPTQ